MEKVYFVVFCRLISIVLKLPGKGPRLGQILFAFALSVGIVVVKNLGSHKFLLILLLKLAEWLLLTNGCRANEIWSASIVAVVF